MRNAEAPDFIIIDDDPIANKICTRIIHRKFPGAVVSPFTDPTEGVDYLQEKYNHPGNHNAVLFLDINMPILTGWDVLARISHLVGVREEMKIFILSSSVEERDRQRAEDHPLVSGFIRKPLSDQFWPLLTDDVKDTRLR